MPDPTTEGMRLDQIERASARSSARTRRRSAAAEKPHARRADKADYLREKLAERAKAEDEAAAGD